MTTADEVLALLERRGALLRGHFVLSSGRHSDCFIQKFRVFEDPPTAQALCDALADRLAGARPDLVVSAAVGGIIPGFLVAAALGVRNIFVEKAAGKPVLRRGFTIAPGERVAIVEDVMTTGKSTREVADVVESLGGTVVAIGAIVRRGSADLPQPVSALLELPLEDYPPERCPLCRQGLALEDPGSRRA